MLVMLFMTLPKPQIERGRNCLKTSSNNRYAWDVSASKQANEVSCSKPWFGNNN